MQGGGKDKKVAWLKKVQAVIGHALSEDPAAKAEKVVAGKEPEETNRLLQQLARAANKGPCEDAVKKALSSGSEETPAPSQETPPQPPEPQPEEERPGDEAAPTQPRESREAEASAPSQTEQGRQQEEHQGHDGSNERRGQEERREKKREEEEDLTAQLGETNQSTALGGARRPVSARKKKPPRQDHGRKYHAAEEEGFQGRVIGEESKQQEEEEQGGVVFADEEETGGPGAREEGGGKLVSDLMRAQEGPQEADQGQEDGGEHGEGIVLRPRGKGKKGGKKGEGKGPAAGPVKQDADPDKAREAVQDLVRKARPLGQAIERLGEDEEAVEKERQHWRREREQAEAELEPDARLEDEHHGQAGSPDARVKELRRLVDEERERCRQARGRLMRNEERIASLLGLVFSPSAHSN